MNLKTLRVDLWMEGVKETAEGMEWFFCAQECTEVTNDCGWPHQVSSSPRMTWEHQDYLVCPRGSWELADPKTLWYDLYKGWLSPDGQVSTSHLSSCAGEEQCPLKRDAPHTPNLHSSAFCSLKLRGNHRERVGTPKKLKLNFYCLQESGFNISINFIYRTVNLLCAQLSLWTEIQYDLGFRKT